MKARRSRCGHLTPADLPHCTDIRKGHALNAPFGKASFHEKIAAAQVSHDPPRTVQRTQRQQGVPEDLHGNSGCRYRTVSSGDKAFLLLTQISEGMRRAVGIGAFPHQRLQREALRCGHAVHFQKGTVGPLPFGAVRQDQRTGGQHRLFRDDASDTAAKFLIHALLLLCLTAQPEIGAAQLSAVGRFLLPAFQRGRTAQPHPMAVEELFQHDGLTGRLAAHLVEQGVFVFCKQILQHELFSVQERQDRSIRQRLAPHLFPAYHLVNLLCAGRRVWAAAGLRTNSSEKWKFLLKFLPKICADWRMDFPSRVVYNGDPDLTCTNTFYFLKYPSAME